jgi:vacuolar-type H+-ATPase subunit D/Vma8
VDAAEQRLRAEIAGQRVDILRLQVRRIAQRVNLFDKILIPEAQRNIQRIRICLGDAERCWKTKLAARRAKSGMFSMPPRRPRAGRVPGGCRLYLHP